MECYRSYIQRQWVLQDRQQMSQSRKYRGYRTQKVVADYLKQWYPHAESTGAGRQGADITGVPYDIEVKARTGFQPLEAIKQLKLRRSDKLGFVVMRMNGQGENAEDYVALMPLGELMRVLHE
jgi:hypothetical protein